MHGATVEENKKILKEKVVTRVAKMYEAKGNIQEGFEYMFQESIEDLCQRSTQYLTKWVSSCRLAMKKGKGGGENKTQKKNWSKTKVKANNREVDQDMGVTRQVAPYSGSHKRWIDKETPRDYSGNIGDDQG